MVERKVRDRWETGGMIPLPREIFDHSLSDDQLQDRWVAEAERKVLELREQKARLLDDLAALRKSLADAEAFLAEAKDRQRHYRETKTQPVPRPSHVQALLTRRTPAQVQALLVGVSAQGTEITRLPNDEDARRSHGVLPANEFAERQGLDSLLEETNRPLLPDGEEAMDATWRPLLPKP